jgi:hypothetical protein
MLDAAKARLSLLGHVTPLATTRTTTTTTSSHLTARRTILKFGYAHIAIFTCQNLAQ